MMRYMGVLALLLLGWAWSAQAQETATLTHPVAYIGRDGNLYVTDGTTVLPITTDAGEFEQGIAYDQPRWSPDGSRLVFFRTTAEEGVSMMLVESGSSPQELVGAFDGVYFENQVIAWSPDNAQIAFIGGDGQHFGLFTISVIDGRVQFVAETLGPSIGEADPALSVAAAETGRSAYRERFDVGWSEEGIVYWAAASCFCTALVTPRGEVLEAWSLESRILLSAEGFYIMESDAESSEETTLEDVARQVEVSVELNPVAWMDGALIYTTRTILASVTGDPVLQTGIEVEDRWLWSFTAENATLQLWQYNPSGDDTLVFETEGYGFGMVRPTTDHHLLVSVITSNFDALTALNSGASLEDIEDTLAHPITYLINNGEVVLTIDGSQPDYSNGSFTVASSA